MAIYTNFTQEQLIRPTHIAVVQFQQKRRQKLYNTGSLDLPTQHIYRKLNTQGPRAVDVSSDHTVSGQSRPLGLHTIFLLSAYLK